MALRATTSGPRSRTEAFSGKAMMALSAVVNVLSFTFVAWQSVVVPEEVAPR